MTILTQSGTFDANGDATVTFEHIKSGIKWIVSQISVEVQPSNQSETANITLNGRFVTSTPYATADSAQGPPFITLKAGDSLRAVFENGDNGATAIVSILYEEKLWQDTSPFAGWQT